MAQKIKVAPLFLQHKDELVQLARSVLHSFVGNSGDTDSTEVFATVTLTEWVAGGPTHVVVANVDLDDDESRITSTIAMACNGLDEDADYTVTVTLEDREASHDPVAASIDLYSDTELEAHAEVEDDKTSIAAASHT